MSRVVDINPQVLEAIRDSRLPMDDTLGVLILIYHGVKPKYVPVEFAQKVFTTGIVKYDPVTKTYDWKFGLYETEQTSYDWVKDWMDLFKAVNPDRRGTRATVVRRFKEFFANNPQYNVEDVNRATKAYLQGVTDPQYCKTSHKFIKDQDGSKLLEQLEKLKVTQREGNSYSRFIKRR